MATRPAEITDAPAIAEVQVLTWQAAYSELVSRTYLANLSVEQATRKWRGILLDPPEGQGVQVALDGDAVVGFVAHGPAGDAFAADRVGEVYSLYVHPSRWRAGHGSALLSKASSELQEAGFRSAILWVLPGNAPARRFYEAHGWSDDAIESVGSLQGVPTPHMRYSRPLGPWSPDSSAESVS